MRLVNDRMNEYGDKRKKSRVRRKILTTMACIVVFCTVYALILPAITLEGKIYCGKTEHEHTDKCYSKEVVSTEEKLVCGKEEVEPHQHTEECYSEIKTETTETVQPQDEDRKEEEKDSTQESSLQRELTCDKKETKGHVHTQACYETVNIYGGSQLICEKEEHMHSLQCYSNPEADVETEAEWEETMAGVTFTRDWVEDSIAVAKSQLGYKESSANYEVVNGNEKKGYTRYGDFYGVKYGDWCAMFVFFCLHYAEVEDFPIDASCDHWIAQLKELEEDSKDREGVVQYDVYREASEDYVPERGNLIFFNWDTLADADHVGIVVDVTQEDEDTIIRTIEGNASNTVKYKEYDLDDDTIMGYGILPEQEFYCGESAHVHDSDCYDENCAQSCEEEEHVHTDACEVEETARQGKQSQYAVESLANDEEVTVYQVNKYSQAVATVVYGGSAREKLGTELSFAYWDAIIIEKNDSGQLYVSQYITEAESKLDYKASTSDGFVLFLYNQSVDAKAGDTVVVQFDITAVTGYNANGFGKIVFNPTSEVTGTQKTEKDNSSKLKTVQGADTRDKIEVNLYDYGNNINDKYSTDNKYPGFQQDGGQKSVSDTASSNFGNNITADLAAGKSGVTTGNDVTGINKVTGAANYPISYATEVMYPTLKNGYPALSNEMSLAYLFSDNTYAEKKNSKSINGLFQYNEETGAYTFNSRENHAQFNAENDTFTLYDQVISSNFIWYPFGNFLPFNDIVHEATQASACNREYFKTIESSARYKENTGSGSEYSTLANSLNTWIDKMDSSTKSTNWKATDALDAYFIGSSNKPSFTAPDGKTTEEFLDNVYSIDYDEATDFFFGMEMKMKFMQPKGGLTGKDGQQPMVFYFTGDDDVWIYVDDKLFLDLSGIHRHVGGEIDFVNGVVKYYALDVSTGDVSTTPYKTLKFEDILGSTDGLNGKGTFEDYSTHTFNFYYMERGAGSGVCRMNFNFPLLHKNSISVTKELSADAKLDLLGNPDFKFQVLEGATGEEPFIGADVSYDIYDTAGTKIGTGTTGANGVFTIKAGQTAVFSNINENAGTYRVRELLDESVFQQYGKVSVDGSDTTSNAYTNVKINSETFMGIESPVKNISDGNTSFKFNNNVTTSKVGGLQLTKKVEGETTDVAFKFTVKLDGELLKVGTPYTVTKDGMTTENTVKSEGIVEVSAGGTATITNILAGSKFEVQETTDSAKGYIVDYTGGTITTIDDRNAVTGIIGAEATVQLTATNTVNGTSVTIPGEKQLLDADGKEHTYTMELVEVTDATGETEVNSKYSQTAEVTVSGTSKEFAFTIPYTEKAVGTVPRTYFYKIFELNKTGDLTTKYDASTYVVEVNVSKDTAGKLTAKVVHVWKDGMEVTNQKVTFTNQQLYTLILQKVLEAPEGSGSNDEFTFEITLSKNESPVKGEFTISKGAETSMLTFDENGKATVIIAAGETLTIHGLPKNIEWKIRETNTEGYHVTYQVGTSETVTEGSSTSGTLIEQDTTVTCTNKTSYELPENGGMGTAVVTIGGCVLLGAAWIMYRKRKWY